MVRIRRIGIIKAANMMAALYTLIGIIALIVLFLPMGMLVAMVGSMPGGGGMGSFGPVAALLFAFFMVLGYAIVGWVSTAIACAIYNALAGWMGGIEVELVSVVPPQGYQRQPG